MNIFKLPPNPFPRESENFNDATIPLLPGNAFRGRSEIEKFNTAITSTTSTLNDDRKYRLSIVLPTYIKQNLITTPKALTLTDPQIMVLNCALVRTDIFSGDLELIKAIELPELIVECLTPEDEAREILTKYHLTIEKLVDSSPEGVRFVFNNQWIQKMADTSQVSLEFILKLKPDQVAILKNPVAQQIIERKEIPIETIIGSGELRHLFNLILAHSWISKPVISGTLSLLEIINAKSENILFLLQKQWAGKNAWWTKYGLTGVKTVLNLSDDALNLLHNQPVQQALDEDDLTLDQISTLSVAEITLKVKQFVDKKNHSPWLLYPGNKFWSADWFG